MRRQTITFMLLLLIMVFLSPILRAHSVKSGIICIYPVQNIENTYAPQACLNPEDIIWKQFSMRNEWQKENNLLGGEGMQWVHDFDWSRNDTDILYLVTRRIIVKCTDNFM